MLNTIIYDETGSIIMTTSQTGYGKISAIEADIPDGYYAASVNTETGEVVLEEIPKSDEQQQIDELKKAVEELKNASDEQKKVTDAMLGVTEEESEETA